jgi:hypothetical protein
MLAMTPVIKTKIAIQEKIGKIPPPGELTKRTPTKFVREPETKEDRKRDALAAFLSSAMENVLDPFAPCHCSYVVLCGASQERIKGEHASRSHSPMSD